MNIKQLAGSMDATEKDVESLLSMVTTAFQEDKVTDDFIKMKEEQQSEMVQAYIASELKKFENFCTQLLVNSEKKSAFDLYVLSLMKES